ncbi:hypothetical protein ASC64_07210 [Nocardioides sp. Root122]|uniref:VTT domain-containing protein n=1 Tax=Nocardioides TaxID=1839 RepID=UPI000702BBC8|nr:MULTISPECIES: VTT domain-containing protein [Nocardioides]KQV69623.1 hypothetical protein ASC64_07210 [Nocardioides sp. Root122]MCK9824443.1 VTT domain-containing protein [Nocardioides cavernae]
MSRKCFHALFIVWDSRWLSRAHVARAEAFFERHGAKAVLLARFVPVIRTLVPAVAGMGRMPARRFTAYNVAGALAWAVGIMVAGFFLGGVPLIAGHFEILVLAVVAASLLPALIGALRRIRPLRRRASHQVACRYVAGESRT